jgi:DNA-binding PadR family transcriptional regulator
VPRGRPGSLPTHHYLILLALLDGAAHGLGIAREVERLSEGRVRLWPATLYGSLEELRERGLIEELEEDRPPEASDKKRFYRIAPSGREVARAETRRLEDLVKVARGRVKARRGTA